MAENAAQRRGGFSRNYPRSLELEIINLHALHTHNADSLKGAFSDPVVEMLRQLSEEEFFQRPDSASPHHSSYHADVSGLSTLADNTLASSLANTPEENWQTTRSLFEFIYTEFMPAPKEEQMGKFQRFLDRILETAHRLRPDGSRFNPEDNPKVKQCLLAVHTMKHTIITKFQNVTKFMKKGPAPAARPGAGIGSFSGARQTGDASTSNPPRGASQNAPERNDLLGSLPPRNPEASRVIIENPIHAAGGSQLPRPAQQTRPSVVQTNPAHPSSHGASGGDQEDGSTSSPPRKRPPLRRQSHVPEND